MRIGKIFIVSGPSGAGKSTLCLEVTKLFSDVKVSISHTTRSPRVGEIDGKDYYFVTPEEFQHMRDKQLLVEWAEVHGNFYGTGKEFLERTVKEGNHILLDIDVQGARSIRKLYPEAISIFILPPSMEELKRRLVRRGSESDESLKRRLATAQQELKESPLFNYKIENHDLKLTVRLLAEIVRKEKDK